MEESTPILQCPGRFSEEPGIIAFNFVLIGISVIVILVFAFIKQRTRLAQGCCNGRPGIPVPMDFLITPYHRWIYVAIFGVMAFNLFSVYREVNADNIFLWLFLNMIFLPLLVISMMGLLFAPLFLCVDAPFTLFGHVIGLVYSLLWFGYNFTMQIGQYVRSAQVPQCSLSHVAIDIFRDFPYLVVNGIIVLWYIYQVITGTRKFIKNKKDILGSYVTRKFMNETPRFSDTCRDYQVSCVVTLLKPIKEVNTNRSKVKALLRKIWKFLIPFDRNFRLPLPFLGAFSAALMLLYQLTFILGTYGLYIANGVNLFVMYLLSSSLSQNAFPSSSASIINSSISTSFSVGLPVIVTLSPVLAFFTCLLLLFHMVGSVSKVMKEAAKEGFSEKLPGVLKRVPSSWKYIGLQIGFCIFAWLVYYFVYFVIGISIGVIINLLIIPVTRDLMIRAIVLTIVPLIWTKVVFYVQFLVCNFFFLLDKKGKFICITNRNVFNCCAYLLFFYNGIAGFFGALVRLAVSAGVGMLLLFRLDQNVLTHTFAFLDFGHKAFLGFFYLDYAYNNAVVHVFIKILKESVFHDECIAARERETAKQNDDGSASNGVALHSSGNYSQRRIRNRWLVAYTLVRNSSLQCLTGNRLKLKHEVIQEGTSEKPFSNSCGINCSDVA